MKHRISRRYLPGNFAECLYTFRVSYPGELIAVQARVSSYPQKSEGNAQTQQDRLSKAILDAGGVPHVLPQKTAPGYGERWIKELKEMGNTLRSSGIKKILFATADRFSRSRLFKSSDKEAWAIQSSRFELQQCLEAIGPNIQVMTLNPPNATPEDNRALLIKWGQANKSKGGRPLKRDNFRSRWLPYAKELKEKGYTLQSISDAITDRFRRYVSTFSVGSWLRDERY